MQKRENGQSGDERSACNRGGRESSKTKRKSQTYFHHSRKRGRGAANQAAMQTLRTAKWTSKLPRAAKHAAGMSRYPSNLRRGRGSTASNALACVRECEKRARQRKRAKPPKWPFRDSKRWSTPSFIITPVPRRIRRYHRDKTLLRKRLSLHIHSKYDTTQSK